MYVGSPHCFPSADLGHLHHWRLVLLCPDYMTVVSRSSGTTRYFIDYRVAVAYRRFTHHRRLNSLWQLINLNVSIMLYRTWEKHLRNMVPVKDNMLSYYKSSVWVRYSSPYLCPGLTSCPCRKFLESLNLIARSNYTHSRSRFPLGLE